MYRTAVIGSGFAGLSAACFMAHAGYKVEVFEKNEDIGGRARAFSQDGFMFDMGPSWYWMPDVFERFFAAFNKRPEDYYQLKQLDPAFQMIFGKGDVLIIPAKPADIMDLFESIEPGSATMLHKFLAEGKYKYEVGMRQLVYNPSFSWLEFANYEVLSGVTNMHMFKSMRSYVQKFFKDERLIALMEFPVLFLGAMAKQIPALYSLMNYAALSLGTWYPMGGMTEVVLAMEKLALSKGVVFHRGAEVMEILIKGGKATGMKIGDKLVSTESIIATGDYHHIEQNLLEKPFRNYNEKYWEKRTFAPSCLIFYIGVNKKVKKLLHHNLFFDSSLDNHSKDIYQDPQWPTDPLFYVCCPSKTDDSVAPDGMENLFVLIPIAPGLIDTAEIRDRYFRIVFDRMASYCEEDSLEKHIVYKKSYCVNDFVQDYHAYKGNAYGLSNTLAQTAVLKPTLRNKTIKNLFYAGQLTVPGPGVPPSLISGQIASEQLQKYFK